MSDLHAGAAGPTFPVLTLARITDDRDLRDRLAKVAASGCELLHDCAGASVTIIEQHRALTAASTNEDAEALDQAQYDAKAGPCLSAATTGHAIRLDVIGTDARWPEFAAEASARGVRSSLSMPLTLGGETAGGLNLYGRIDAAFTDDDVRTAQAFAAQASVVISNAQAYWAAFDKTRHLTAAMEHRAVIEQAKGILMARLGLSDQEAFSQLVRRSQAENRKLREVAAEFVDEARNNASQP